MAWKNTSTSRGVGAAPTLTGDDLVEAEHRAQAGEQLAVGLGDASRRAPSGTGSPRLLELDLARSRRRAQAAAALARSSGWPASIASSPALSFSQMRGTAKNHVGRDRRQVARRSRAGSGSVVIVIA